MVTDMKKLFDEDDSEIENTDKAKILVSVIPAVLIIILLAVMLLVNRGKGEKADSDNLQQSIMDYADETIKKDGSLTEGGTKDNKQDNIVQKDVSQNSDKVSTDAAPDGQEENLQSTIAIPTPYRPVMDIGQTDYSQVTYNRDEQLKEMMTYWADNNQKALDDLANLDRFKAMSWQLRGTKDFYYYGETSNQVPNGTGIAVYADNQYYYGSWENGVRSGNGTWIHYHIHTAPNQTDLWTYHQYTGSWKNDLPDGEGSEHYDFDTTLFKKNSRYIGNLIGTYSEGLVDGEFYITTININEDMEEWEGTGDHGTWVYQNANVDPKGNRTVQVDIHDPDNYMWMHPKVNNGIGVPCVISKKKNG